MKFQLVIAAAACSLLAAQAQQPEQKPLLNGTWTVVSLENDGTKTPEKDVAGMKFIFAGNKLVIRKGKKTLGSGTLKIDVSKRPHLFDYREGPDITSPYDTGILEVKGAEMKLCTTADRQKRPTAFDSKQGWLFVLKKDKGKP